MRTSPNTRLHEPTEFKTAQTDWLTRSKFRAVGVKTCKIFTICQFDDRNSWAAANGGTILAHIRNFTGKTDRILAAMLLCVLPLRDELFNSVLARRAILTRAATPHRCQDLRLFRVTRAAHYPLMRWSVTGWGLNGWRRRRRNQL